jgi:hypothetical protein
MWQPVALAGLASACGRIGFEQIADATPTALVQIQAPGIDHVHYCRAMDPSGSGAARSDEAGSLPTIASSR